MPCYHPLSGWVSGVKNPSGKRGVVFNPRDGIGYKPVEIPCGQCIGCRLERSRQWAMRCVHEAQLHKQNCFVTLTYDNEHLPVGGSLVLRDFQLFMKRLRKSSDGKIRFFHCGEYGENFSRPHYHAILFGYDFADRAAWSVRDGIRLYRSAQLERLWPYGFATVGDATFESAAYVARYCVKKVTGSGALAHYGGRAPEYVTMSRRPGIGRGWFDKFRSDVYPSDEVVIRNGVRCRPPKFYDSILEVDAPARLESIKLERVRRARQSPDNSGRRLTDRGDVKEAQSRFLRRGVESGDY